MKNLEWYLFQNDQQLGPFAVEQLAQLNHNKMIAQNAYIFKMGWDDWKPISEAWDQLGFQGMAPSVEIPTPSRRGGFASRVAVTGSVILHNDEHVVEGSGANISETGLFIETKEQPFNVGDLIKLTLRIDTMTRSYNTGAYVIRYNSNPSWPVGYGLTFHEAPSKLIAEIKKIIELDRHKVQIEISNNKKMKVANG